MALLKHRKISLYEWRDNKKTNSLDDNTEYTLFWGNKLVGRAIGEQLLAGVLLYQETRPAPSAGHQILFDNPISVHAGEKIKVKVFEQYTDEGARGPSTSEMVIHFRGEVTCYYPDIHPISPDNYLSVYGENISQDIFLNASLESSVNNMTDTQDPVSEKMIGLKISVGYTNSTYKGSLNHSMTIMIYLEP